MEAGRITGQEYDQIVSLWQAGLPALKAHPSSLVHGSAFPWTACLTAAGDGWQVSRLNALGDVLWWDPAYDQASWEYPPFYAWPAACLDAFWNAYGQQPDLWRIRTYALLQHVCALNQAYMPPPLSPCCEALSEEGMIARLREILSLL